MKKSRQRSRSSSTVIELFATGRELSSSTVSGWCAVKTGSSTWGSLASCVSETGVSVSMRVSSGTAAVSSVSSGGAVCPGASGTVPFPQEKRERIREITTERYKAFFMVAVLPFVSDRGLGILYLRYECVIFEFGQINTP